MTAPAPALPVAFWISLCWLAIRIAAADIPAATRPLSVSVQRLRLTAKAARNAMAVAITPKREKVR